MKFVEFMRVLNGAVRLVKLDLMIFIPHRKVVFEELVVKNYLVK